MPDKLFALLLGNQEQGEAFSGARSAQAHSDAGDSRSVLGRKSQSRAHYGQLLLAHTSVDGLRFGSSHTRDKISL